MPFVRYFIRTVVGPHFTLLVQFHPREDVRFFAYADDMAVLLNQLFIDLPKLWVSFQIIAKASSLKINVKKCCLVPLRKHDAKALRTQIAKIVPALAVTLIEVRSAI